MEYTTKLLSKSPKRTMWSVIILGINLTILLALTFNFFSGGVAKNTGLTRNLTLSFLQENQFNLMLFPWILIQATMVIPKIPIKYLYQLKTPQQITLKIWKDVWRYQLKFVFIEIVTAIIALFYFRSSLLAHTISASNEFLGGIIFIQFQGWLISTTFVLISVKNLAKNTTTTFVFTILLILLNLCNTTFFHENYSFLGLVNILNVSRLSFLLVFLNFLMLIFTIVLEEIFIEWLIRQSDFTISY